MYGWQKPKNGQYNHGRWFREAPTLPATSGGEPFRFEWLARDNRDEEHTMNLAHNKTSGGIKTVSSLPFRAETFVLLDGDLYKINAIASEPVRKQARSVVRSNQYVHTMTITKINNPTQIGRL